MITVNGKTIGAEDVNREAQYHPAPAREEALRRAATALVVRELLLQEAAEKGLCGPEDVTSAERVIDALLDRAIQVRAPDERSTRAYYEEHHDRFRSPDLFEASHILFSFPRGDEADRARALEAARATLVELDRNPDSFERFARDRSSDPEAREQGGRMGQITRGQTPEAFEACLDSLAPGRICPEPVLTDRGYHVVRLDRAVRGRHLAYEMARERIEEYLGAREWTQAFRIYVESLASRARIDGITLDPGSVTDPTSGPGAIPPPGRPLGR